MAAYHRHADAGAADLQLRQVHDLAALVLHLHLLGGIALEGFAADLRDDVIGDLILEHLGRDTLALTQQLHLLHQLLRAACARAGHGLIAGGHNALDGAVVVQGVNGHQADDGGAVGVGDDALVLFGILRVDLRDDQRHVRVKAEGAGVIHEHRAGLDDGGSEALGDVVLRRAQDDVHALKRLVAGQLHGDVPPVPGQHLAHGALRGQQVQLVHREIPLCQHLHHLAAYRAGSAQNRNVIFFHGCSSLLFHKAVVQDTDGPLEVRAVHAHDDVQLLRALGDHADVDAVFAQLAEDLAG